MKSWEEIKGKEYVYLAEDLHTTTDDEIEIIIPQFQKCDVEYVEFNEILLIVSSGKFSGIELYYHTNKDKAEELLTADEFKLINVTETKIRKELIKIAKSIESLKETPSDDLKYVYHTIKDRIK